MITLVQQQQQQQDTEQVVVGRRRRVAGAAWPVKARLCGKGDMGHSSPPPSLPKGPYDRIIEFVSGSFHTPKSVSIPTDSVTAQRRL